MFKCKALLLECVQFIWNIARALERTIIMTSHRQAAINGRSKLSSRASGNKAMPKNRSALKLLL